MYNFETIETLKPWEVCTFNVCSRSKVIYKIAFVFTFSQEKLYLEP